jgi:hypothetical protein
MKIRISAIVAVCLSVAVLSSCTVNRKVAYHTVKTDIAASPAQSYTIATHDQRLPVTDQSQKETLVGYFRSTVAIAYPISTQSGNNFSDDFSLIIKNSMNVAGGKAQILTTRYNESKDIILKKMNITQSDRLILFTVNNWLTDSKPIGMEYGTEVIWDMTVEIFNKNGELLATNKTAGFDPKLDLSAAGSVKKIQKIVDVKLKEKIDILMNTPEIQKALNP